MKYLFSIIIPTYKRKASLIRLLESLVSEMKLQYEIIIVEQVITNKKEFYQFAKEHNLNINYIFLHEASTPHAKNIGAVSAKGKYLIFFDDDVVVEKGVFDGYEKAFIKDRNHIVAGRVLTPGHPINPKSKNVGKISYFGKFSDDYTSDFKQQVDTVIGCNAGWEKEVFENVGGFDEQITMNGIREESDLSLRAKDMGYKIFFEPNATVIHLREETGGGRKSEGRLSWYYNFISNDTYFFLKYRPKWVVFIILLTRWEWFLRCMFGFGREVSIKSIATPLLGILYGFRKYNSWKRLQRRLKIGVDAGCLGIQDKRLKVGVYQVAKNLLIELAKIDNKNQYLLYSFYPINKKLMRELGPQMQNIVVSPSRGWTKLWLPLRLFRDRPDIFIGLSQSLPQRIPSNRYKTLLLMYDLAFEEYPQSYRDYSRISKITSLAVMSADKIITISEHVKKDILGKYSNIKSKISVLYLGTRFLSKKTEFSVPKHYFLSVGALKQIKNISTILRAYEKFNTLNKKKYKLLIVGGDKWLDLSIHQEFSKLRPEIKKSINFLGFLSDKDLEGIYQGATALISPSLYEGFGLPLVEAMASGCPVIASNAGAIPEIVGDAGLLADPMDYKQIAKYMEMVVTDKKLRKDMIKKGKERAKLYSWEKFAKGVLDIINSYEKK